MRLSGRLQAAIDVLSSITQQKRPASEALKDWGLTHRFAGSSDRAAIGNLVYDALRSASLLAWRMGSDDALCLAYGALLSQGDISIAQLQAEFTDDCFAPIALSRQQQLCWEEYQVGQAPDDIRSNLPKWVIPFFQKSFQTQWVQQGIALAARPPLDLRVNPLKSNSEKVKAEILSALDVNNDLPNALRISPIMGMGRHPNVQNSKAYQKGWVEIQDLGSQMAAYLSGAQAGMKVLDYCAGAGGKTLALSAQMLNKGQIYAYDISTARLSPIYARLQRAGCRNVQIIDRAERLIELEGKMDVVLLDAPCSGSGTWRRTPDAKWRLSTQQLQGRQNEQKHVLETAGSYLRSQGRIVYITCSLLSAENEEQIVDFLNTHQQYRAVDMRQYWDKMFPHTFLNPVFPSHGVLLSPHGTGTDGFYVCVLEKNN